jgi:predicted kinase
MPQSDVAAGALHPRPVVMLLLGLPGVGKSTVGRLLAGLLSCQHVSTENIGATIFRHEIINEDRDFSSEELAAIYERIVDIVQNALHAHESVVVEGVFRSNAQRSRIYKVCEDAAADCITFRVTCDESVVLDRLRERKRRGSPSPAGIAGYMALKAIFESVNAPYLTIDTTLWQAELQRHGSSGEQNA